MRIAFFIKSSTVNLENYTIKDIPGSSGRLDVISRAILAALLGEGVLEEKVTIWVFLEKYGVFTFNSKDFNNENFPRNEISLTDYFVKYINNSTLLNPLEMIKRKELDIYNALEGFIAQNYQVFILQEDGQDFYSLFKSFNHKSKLLFIIGNQTGEIITSEDIDRYNLTRISLGSQSYLASTVVRLIKLNLKLIM